MNSKTNTEQAVASLPDDMLKELFRQLDAPIMVADLETDEILYVNKRWNEAYGVYYDPIGERCWETYQVNKVGRCDFCPLDELKKSPSKSHEWEAYNTATGRWFRNISKIIRWSDGRLVHFEQSTDITNIRKMNDALYDSKTYTRLMLDSTPLICSIWDEDGKIIDCNFETVRIFGLQDKTEYLDNFYNLNPDLQPDGVSSKKKANQVIAQAFETGSARFEWEYKSKNGEIIPVDVMLVRVPWKNGYRVLSYSKDLRQIKKADAALKRYTHLLRTANNIAGALMTASSDSLNDTVTEQLKILGEAVGVERINVWENYTRDDVIYHKKTFRWVADEKWGRGAFPLYHELNYDTLADHKAQLFSLQTINRLVRDMPEAEQQVFLSQSVKAVLMIPIMLHNSLWGFISFDRCLEEELTPENDIAVLKSIGIMIASAITRNRMTKNLVAAGQELQMDKRLLAAVNHVAENLLASNSFDDFTQVMQGCLEILGKSVEADRVSIWRNFEDADGLLCSRRLPGWIKGKSYEQASGEYVFDFASALPGWDKSATNREDITFSLHAERESLREHPLLRDSKSLTLVHIEMDGEFWGFIAYAHDKDEYLPNQTELGILRSGGTMIAAAIIEYEVNQKLMAATDEALASVRAKNEFMARMSHEIRTPMNAVIGMTAISQKSDDMGKIKESLDVIAASSQQLLTMINDILDMSNIDMGTLSIDSGPYDLEQVINDTIGIFLPQIKGKKQHFNYKQSSVFKRFIIGDAKRTAQIVYNLLSNAVKFTPEGGEISLELHTRPLQGEDTALLVIEVVDNGIGIDSNFLSRAFDLFEQVDGGITREYGGVGLGLTITKSLVSLMGGSILVESEPGKGSHFVVELPIALGDVCKADLPSWHDKRVLLVEDIEINQLIALELMADTGVEVECAENGKQALDMVLATPEKYDLILMDMQMPVMDGLEATRQIRSASVPRAKTIPIYAMTANAYKEDAEACMQAGMNGHIPKPIDTTVLYRAMKEAFSV